MQTTLETLEHYPNSDRARASNLGLVLGRWLGELFGCPHKEMSRPFSRQGESFRVCITCGARRQFDEKNWNMVGPFYYKTARKSDLQ
ncbi:MAG TPA: hypothetical protein VF899_13925 [Pyrinomonadaceae bacterium]